MKEIGLSRPEWTSPEWPSLAVGDVTPGAMPPCVALQPGRDHHSAGERLRGRHMSGGRRSLDSANVGVTEDWGQVVRSIKDDLNWLSEHFAL